MAEGKKPRVMLVGQMPPTKGGMTTFILNLIGSHLREEFDFVPYSTSRPPKLNTVDNWGYLSMFRGGIRRLLYGIVITLWRLMKFPFVVIGSRIDLVQIQASDFQAFWEAIAYALLARATGRRVIIRIGGAFDVFFEGSSSLMQKLISASVKVADILIVQSQYFHGLVRRVAGPEAEIIVLPNWTRVTAAGDGARPPTAYPVCVFIAGSEAKRKGFEEVLAATTRLDRDGSPARFHLIAMPPQLVERVGRLNLGNIAVMDGPLENREVITSMQASDIFLLPSHAEGFPNSLIEAMATGLPSVVTPVAAVPEVVDDGGALVVPVGDGVALADAIDRLARDPTLRARLGREGKATVERRYTAQRALPPLAAAYRRLLPANRRLSEEKVRS